MLQSPLDHFNQPFWPESADGNLANLPRSGFNQPDSRCHKCLDPQYARQLLRIKLVSLSQQNV